jgi:type II secretory pathway pseudopilin PulG
MTDVPPANPPLPPDIQAQVDQIEQDIAAQQAAAAAAAAAIQQAIDTMVSAKQVCLDSCGPLSDLIAQTTDPTELSALLTLAEQTHAPHAAELEAAYQTFVGSTADQANLAEPGVTQIESGVSAEGGAAG